MAEPLLDSKNPKPSSLNLNNSYNPKPFSKVTFSTTASIFIMVISFPLLYYYSSHIPTSTLLKDTKFWFFLSNTIILIVAADSGAFSPSNEASMDLYEEYLKQKRLREDRVASIATEEPKRVDEFIIHQDKSNDKEEEEEGEEVEKVEVEEEEEEVEKVEEEEEEEEVEKVEEEDEEVEKVEEEEEGSSKDCEFDDMSRDELNRRVDEFIKRFNRQIRLQQMVDE